MHIEVLDSEDAIATRAADIIGTAVAAKPDANLGLPTGATPIRTYGELERRVAARTIDLARTTAYAIDEFTGVPTATPGTNAAFYAEHLRLNLRALHCPDAGAPDPDAEIRSFASAISAAGGLDLCMLGVGANGHVAFNEPGSALDSEARVVELTLPSRAAHGAQFGSFKLVPRRGMTLGITDLLTSRAILVLVTGAHKAAIVRASIEGPPSPDVPASWLQSHADVTWLLDASAARYLA